ncbi:hypothetical protein COCNU_scaffold002618G000020 [Cocos nucifera]|nr:hypothetical protein [Cocos nucifera]
MVMKGKGCSLNVYGRNPEVMVLPRIACSSADHSIERSGLCFNTCAVPKFPSVATAAVLPLLGFLAAAAPPPPPSPPPCKEVGSGPPWVPS